LALDACLMMQSGVQTMLQSLIHAKVEGMELQFTETAQGTLQGTCFMWFAMLA
jgi:hypothetical protein